MTNRRPQAKAAVISSSACRAAEANAATSGPAASSDREALASTEPGGQLEKSADTSLAVAPCAPTPGAKIVPPSSANRK
jgi:hypothetical protein